MFFGRRKSKKTIKDILDPTGYQAILQQFQEEFDRAERTEDVSEKVFKLEKLQEDIQAEIRKKKDAIAVRADASGTLTYFGGNMAQATAVAGIILATGAAPFIVLILPGIIGSAYAGGKVAEKTRNRLFEECGEFLTALDAQKTRASHAEDRVLNDHLDEVAKSSRRDELFGKFPGLKERFGVVAAKKMAEKKPPPPIFGGDAPKFNP